MIRARLASASTTLVAALAAIANAALLYQSLTAPEDRIGSLPTSQYVARFSGLAAYLPRDTPIGFVYGLPSEAASRSDLESITAYRLAQYALAPVLVAPGERFERVVLDAGPVADSVSTELLARQLGERTILVHLQDRLLLFLTRHP